uniref:Uncharacterized protein n=1 Tax=Cacopsylla melanoneura TaxID=428564 RepID=A0A8D8Z468_9HEMI
MCSTFITEKKLLSYNYSTFITFSNLYLPLTETSELYVFSLYNRKETSELHLFYLYSRKETSELNLFYLYNRKEKKTPIFSSYNNTGRKLSILTPPDIFK